MFLNFSDLTIRELNRIVEKLAGIRVIIQETVPKNFWVYLAIIAAEEERHVLPRKPVAAAHPVHLHGHDFALLQQSITPSGEKTLLSLNRDNPTRRIVFLLPTAGFVIIAFKPGKSGSWFLHCHIA